MSFGNIVGGLIRQGLSSQSQNRFRTGTETADRNGGIEQMLGSFLGGGSGSTGNLADLARDFLGNKQAGGLSGAQIGGLGAAAGGLLGGGLGGAVKGGAMAVLGTLALKTWREHQAQAGGMTHASHPSTDEVDALTSPQTERLMLRAMIGAAQVDGHVDDAEMEKILGRMQDDEITEAERQAVREDVQRPVDVAALGREVSRPEVAVEIYLAALLAVNIDTEAEQHYFRQLSNALRLEPGVIDRLHRLTGAPKA